MAEALQASLASESIQVHCIDYYCREHRPSEHDKARHRSSLPSIVWIVVVRTASPSHPRLNVEHTPRLGCHSGAAGGQRPLGRPAARAAGPDLRRAVAASAQPRCRVHLPGMGLCGASHSDPAIRTVCSHSRQWLDNGVCKCSIIFVLP